MMDLTKRIFDLVTSTIACILIAPLMLALMLLIKLDSPGNVIFSQTRVGKAGRLFDILKLRTMVQNAESIGGYSTIEKDNRITRIGGFLRKTSLDELPQLINVVRGEMSLVGPRPDVPAQESNYEVAEWQARCSVKPGITGLAQATLRSSANALERKQLDLEYVNTRSVTLDTQIILLTLRQLASNKSAN
jgi:lipopolysaccharide/colanic/teichoic acid biosynthesis glycosyltransferase